MAPRTRTVPRKRPQQERSRATVDAILVATARILVREGFDRASTNRIADAAGVSIGSLYQYFPSKEALVAALVERHIDRMSAIIEAEIKRVAAAPVEEVVRHMVRVMLEAHAVDPELHRVLNEQVPRFGRLHRVHEVEARATRLARAYLEAHRAELVPQDLDTAAFLVVQTIEALTHGAVLHRPRELGTEALVAEGTALVLRYLLPPARVAAMM